MLVDDITPTHFNYLALNLQSRHTQSSLLVDAVGVIFDEMETMIPNLFKTAWGIPEAINDK